MDDPRPSDMAVFGYIKTSSRCLLLGLFFFSFFLLFCFSVMCCFLLFLPTKIKNWAQSSSGRNKVFWAFFSFLSQLKFNSSFCCASFLFCAGDVKTAASKTWRSRPSFRLSPYLYLNQRCILLDGCLFFCSAASGYPEFYQISFFFSLLFLDEHNCWFVNKFSVCVQVAWHWQAWRLRCWVPIGALTERRGSQFKQKGGFDLIFFNPSIHFSLLIC